MPIDNRIPSPNLDPRTEPQFIGETIYLMIGGVTVAECDRNVAIWEEVKAQIEANGIQVTPKVSELSSARAAESHVALLTNTLRPHVETRLRFNQLPDKIRIELLRQLGVILRPAEPARTTLRFTKLPEFINARVVVPAGTEVTTSDSQVTVATDVDLDSPEGEPSGEVGATAVEVGDIGRVEANSIGLLLQAVAGIESVTNVTALDGGVDKETVEEGEDRATKEMRIGEHLGSTYDFETHISGQNRKGRVTTFENRLSNFAEAGPGHLVVVMQGPDGLAPSLTLLNSIRSVIQKRHVAGIRVSLRAPEFKQFNVSAQVQVGTGQSPATLIDKAMANLKALFSPLTFAYGEQFGERKIGISDIVGAIEDAGPQFIDVKLVDGRPQVKITTGGVEHTSDVPLGIGELPLLGTVTLTPVI